MFETCRVKNLPRTFKKTKLVTVPDKTDQRISALQIKGEKVLHVCCGMLGIVYENYLPPVGVPYLILRSLVRRCERLFTEI